MQQFEVPAVVPWPIVETLGTIPGRNAAHSPARPMYALRTDQGWVDVSAAQFHETVQATARGLIARGVQPGTPVGILAPTRYEWTVLDFALWSVGAFAVPIYDSSSAEQIEWIVRDSGLGTVIVGSTQQRERVAGAVAELPAIWVMDDDLLAMLGSEGAQVPGGEVAARTAAVTPDQPATIVYTSGTTGRPKGCVITHANLVFIARTLVAATRPVVDEPGARTVLFLPLAHVLGRGAQVYCAEGGMQVAHCPAVAMLPADMGSFAPTFLVGVPRVFEKIFSASQQKADDEGRAAVFARSAKVAIDYGSAREAGSPSLWLRMQHAIFDRLVYRKMRAAMGGHLSYAITGGASLGERLGAFYAGIGVTVMEGYGLTETTASGTFNRAEQPRIGSVGQPMPGTQVRIADDGEILLKGPHVMAGYLNRPDATAEVIDADGWFSTGDLGTLDAAGYLQITGRKKEIIVTAGGKNVAPAVLEDRIQANHLISHAIVVGEGRPFVGALITLDPPALEAWARKHRKSGRTVHELRDDSALVQEIQSAVDDANRAVSKAESIRVWRLLDTQFTEQAGQVTPSQKLKRSVITREFADEVEHIYSR